MKKIVLAIATIVFLSSCSINTKYSWYNYNDASYKYYKQQTEETKKDLMEAYEKMLNNQKGTRNIVPPGLCAEYGYILCSEGKKQEGIKYLKMEIELYPESEIFISRIIKQMEE
ncbi:MAG: DUF4810 domain-containing protein [Bacteroidales bacterium]|nr:DUF4810 domain-containing protein [Bacteroidales bacterium]